jgi:hypothetical protein
MGALLCFYPYYETWLLRQFFEGPLVISQQLRCEFMAGYTSSHMFHDIPIVFQSLNNPI